MKTRAAVVGIIALLLLGIWMAGSTDILVGRAPSQAERQASVAERRAEALRTGGLKEAARVTGEFVREIPGPDWGGPATIPELVQESTLIVLGRTALNRSRLDPDGNGIRTAYQFNVESVLKGDRPGPSVTVVLIGGRVVFEDGSIAELRVANSERPVQGERYLLFLHAPKASPASVSDLYAPGEFIPVWDVQGLFRLPGGGGGVVPADRRGRDLAKAIRTMSPGEFLTAVQHAIRVNR
jgi:hypothetical protein